MYRNFFENQAKPPEQKPVVRRTKSNEWKPKPAPQESPKKPAPPPVLQEKPVRENPKPTEPRNQADLVRLALAQQERQRLASEPVQELVMKIMNVSTTTLIRATPLTFWLLALWVNTVLGVLLFFA